MIKHIVLFKMKDGASHGDIEELAAQLLALKDSTDGYMSECEVGKDVARTDRSYDLCLYSLFNTMDDVNKYQTHPEHLKVLDTVKRLCSSAVKVDYPG